MTSVEKQLCAPVHISARCQLLSKGNYTLQGHALMYVTLRGVGAWSREGPPW